MHMIIESQKLTFGGCNIASNFLLTFVMKRGRGRPRKKPALPVPVLPGTVAKEKITMFNLNEKYEELERILNLHPVIILNRCDEKKQVIHHEVDSLNEGMCLEEAIIGDEGDAGSHALAEENLSNKHHEESQNLQIMEAQRDRRNEENPLLGAPYLLEGEPVTEEGIDDDDLDFDSEDLELANAIRDSAAAFHATGSVPKYNWNVCVMWNHIITKKIKEHRQENHKLYGQLGIGKRMSKIAMEIDDCFDYKLPFMLLDVKGLRHHNIDGSMHLEVVETATERNFHVSEDGRLWELIISESCSKLGFEMMRYPATTVMLWGAQVQKHEQCNIGEEPIGRLVLSLHSNDVSAIIFHEEEISVDREARIQRNISRSELCDFSDSSWHMICKCSDTTTFALYASGNTGSIRLRSLDGSEYDSELEESSRDESFKEVASPMDGSESDSNGFIKTFESVRAAENSSQDSLMAVEAEVSGTDEETNGNEKDSQDSKMDGEAVLSVTEEETCGSEKDCQDSKMDGEAESSGTEGRMSKSRSADQPLLKNNADIYINGECVVRDHNEHVYVFPRRRTGLDLEVEDECDGSAEDNDNNVCDDNAKKSRSSDCIDRQDGDVIGDSNGDEDADAIGGCNGGNDELRIEVPGDLPNINLMDVSHEFENDAKRDGDDGLAKNLMAGEEKEPESGVDEENDILESLGILPLKFTTDSQANFLQSQKIPMEDDGSESDGNGEEDKDTTEGRVQHNVGSVDPNEADDSNDYRFTQLLEEL